MRSGKTKENAKSATDAKVRHGYRGENSASFASVAFSFASCVAEELWPVLMKRTTDLPLYSACRILATSIRNARRIGSNAAAARIATSNAIALA